MMKKIQTVILMLLLLALVGCASGAAALGDGDEATQLSGKLTGSIEVDEGGVAEPVYRKISPEEARQMMADSTGYTLLDVRDEREYKEKHIEGALLIPNDEIESRAESELPDKSQLILVFCRSGRRSESAANTLVELGYTNIYDFGGINDWPYETVSE